LDSLEISNLPDQKTIDFIANQKIKVFFTKKRENKMRNLQLNLLNVLSPRKTGKYDSG